VMSADDLQRWASILRWVGLSVTVVGLLITFGSHYIADKLLVVQRGEKAQAQARLQASEAELQATKKKTAELEQKLAPRQLSPDQRTEFIAALANAPRGPVTIAYVSPQAESTAFVQQVRSLIVDAGFTVSAPSEYALGYTIAAPPPWFVAIIAVPGQQPPYASAIQEAFKHIGIEAIGTDGSHIAKPGELKIYIGGR
jgi:hypothetical protein